MTTVSMLFNALIFLVCFKDRAFKLIQCKVTVLLGDLQGTVGNFIHFDTS